jgi:hypothetical protein
MLPVAASRLRPRTTLVVASLFRLRLLFLLAQLLLPTQNARLISRFFSLGNHILALISPRNRSPRQNVFRVKRQNALRRLDGPVEILLGVIGLRQAMERVAKLRVNRQSLTVFRNRFRQFSVAEKVNSVVIMVFRGFRRRVTHAVILASLVLSIPILRAQSGAAHGAASC